MNSLITSAVKPSSVPQTSISRGWFCLRTHSRHEHISGQWIERYLGIEVYVPRIRFRRKERRGLVWSTDALFPNYLFARFELAKRIHQVEAAPGIRRVVRFGAHYPKVPEAIIDTLRATVPAGQVHVIELELQTGETVQVAEGPLQGLEAVITRVMPGRQRVAVLLDLLGRQTAVELDSGALARLEDQRRWIWK